jgi:predicted dehydrogenase
MKKKKIALVGLRFGRVILQQLLTKPATRYFELAGICDLDKKRVEEMRDEFHVPVIPDFDAILNDDEIEAVALITPPWGRADLIHKIIRCNKHVMTTKPFELNPVKAKAILAEAEKTNTVIYLNSPEPDVAKDLVQLGRWQKQFDLGRAVGARADVWAKKVERPGETWYKDPSRCPVAPIFRIGIYLINHLVLMFGEAESVQVMQSKMGEGATMPDNAQMGIRFKSGALCNVYVSFIVKDGIDHRQAFTINFEQGTVFSNVGPRLPEDPVHAIRLRLALPPVKPGKPSRAMEKVLNPHDSYPWESFYDAIEGKHKPQADYFKKILAGINIIEAMSRAEKSGGIEKVMPVD